MAENLASLLMEHPFADADGLLFTLDESVTAGDARATATALAASLRAAGVVDGAAVAVALPNGPAVVTTMFAVWLAGGVFVPVNPRSPGTEVERVLAATDAAAIVGADDRGAPIITGRESTRRYERGVAFVVWTSGTTGPPKAILHTHEAYLELLDRVLGPLRGDTATASAATPKRAPSPNLIPVSLALNAGIYNALFGLRAGAALVIMDRFEPREFAELVRRFEIRSTVLPPAAMAALSDDDRVTDLTPLRYVRSITAPLSPLQARRFTEKFGAAVLNGYGQAEMGEVIGWTAADAKEHPEKVGAIGKPHQGVALKVVGDDGDPAEPDAIGALWVRPPNMAAGYATGEELGDRVDADGYVNTGDLARDRRRRVRVDRGSRRRPHQPGRQQGVSRAGRRGAVPRTRDQRSGGGGCTRRPARGGAGGVRGRRHQRRGSHRAVPRTPRCLQGAGRLRASRCAPAQRGRQGPAPRAVGA